LTCEIILTVALHNGNACAAPLRAIKALKAGDWTGRDAVCARHLKENRGGGGRAICLKPFSS
jgi:hypothetical protein